MDDQKDPFFNQIFIKSEFYEDFKARQVLTHTIEKCWKFYANGDSDSAPSLSQ